MRAQLQSTSAVALMHCAPPQQWQQGDAHQQHSGFGELDVNAACLRRSALWLKWVDGWDMQVLKLLKQGDKSAFVVTCQLRNGRKTEQQVITATPQHP